MKQRIELYIGNIRADIGEQSPVLFTYTAEELRNPTIVKNSYSQQLTLAGTLNNNKIFQSFFRLDAASGDAFNPSKRAPFRIFADGGRVVVAGYCKLDGVQRTGVEVAYKVTLFGGLGGFLYTLQYNDDGTRSLADLTFTDETGTVRDVAFTINRAAVLEAWNNAYTAASLWSIVNFAVCYEGVPDKFDAARALVKAAENGLETSVTKDGKTYSARQGFAEVDLPGDMTAWQVKDLRSYLQRPVLSVRAILRAICNPVNNGGYTVHLDPAFFEDTNSHYYSTWLTLKKLTALALPVETGTARSVISTALQQIDFLGLEANASGLVTIDFAPSFIAVPSSLSAGAVLSWYGYGTGAVQDRRAMRGLLVQAVAYDSEGNAIGGSKVVAFGPAGEAYTDAVQFAKACNGGTLPTPRYDNGTGEEQFGAYYSGQWEVETQGRARWNGDDVTLTIETQRAASVVVYADRVQYNNNYSGGWLEVYENKNIDAVAAVSAMYIEGDMSYTYQTPAEVRSGAQITQQMLLSDTMSPAEFLLSYCKRYGLQIRVNDDTKDVYIERRQTTYSNVEVVDLSGRVDRSREISIVPVPYSTQKMEFKEEPVGAAYAEDYKSRYGHEYGAKRLNTGYEFNAEIKQLLDGYKFKSAPEVKARDLAFLTVANPRRPAVFLNSGLKYRLFAPDNTETTELDVPAIPDTVTYTYWNETYKTYDETPRLQLCDEGGKGLDGDGILVFYQGRRALRPNVFVSDDEPAMFLGNKDKPCWILEPATVYNNGRQQWYALFGRFRYGDAQHTTISEMLEFATPAEIDIPGVTLVPDVDVYALFWRAYMSDRYNPDTKVLTCYIDTNGIRFDAEALRRFYWIDGAVWVLNKIDSLDLNGDGVTKCEFVQVQNISNYII